MEETNHTTRRGFLAAAGATAVGIGVGGPILAALASEKAVEPEHAVSRWAMVVDAAKCRKKDGCRDCAAACHKAHNVPDIGGGDEVLRKKEEIKWIWKEEFQHAFPGQESHYLREDLPGSMVPVLCNHCEHPPCVRVCPTKSTWKRDDGIVMMDMHRCIGCRYCIVACPYGSRSFNWRDPWPRGDDEHPWPNGRPPNPDFPTRMRGVVEKCNLCAERLADDLPPACVEACREGALVFGDVTDPESEVRRLLAENFTIRRRVALGTEPHVFYIIQDK